MATVRSYDSLVTLVRNWANRDAQALPDAIIQDALRYAVDKAYRTLRIPPLEHTAIWTNYPGMYTYTDSADVEVPIDILDAAALATAQEANPGGTYVGALDDATAGAGNVYQSNTCIEVPPDLIEFIHIRGTDENGLTTRVFNEKSDIRSYWDINNGHYNQAAFWSRQGDSVVISPSFANIARGFYGGGAGSETRIEMYYYRRLPALNAVFEVTPNNFNSQVLMYADPQPTGSDIATFLATEGNGVLYFDMHFPVNVDEFLMGDLTAVSAQALDIDGSLWFQEDRVAWPVTAENWNVAGGGRLQYDSTRVNSGVLWFDPQQEALSHAGPVGTNQITISVSDQPVDPATGQVRPEAVTQVQRVREGVTTNLDISFIDTEPGDDGVYVFLSGNNISLAFNPTVRPEDTYIVTFWARPANPGGIEPGVIDLRATAFDNEVDTAQPIPGVRTAFHFERLTDTDSVNTGTFTTADVSDVQTSVFNRQVFFMGNAEFHGRPVPMEQTAYDNNETSTRQAVYYSGTSVPNWFKDENEKIVLYGALAECFAYLQEDDQAGKYIQLMMKEIEELNEEDRMRDASGGNIQTQYTANGLI